MDAYISAIWSFGFNFAPYGWALCNGQLLPIAQNQPLFALIGTTYGGDGVTTFALPNLQGRTPLGMGQGPGLPNYGLGQFGGSENVTLLTSNLPAHTHPLLSVTMPASSAQGESNDPNAGYYASSEPKIGNTYNTAAGTTMGASTPGVTGVTGSGIPISILSPFQVVSYCICLEGIFPSRN